LTAEEPTKAAIKEWWAARPMTYGTAHGETSYQRHGDVESLALGTRDFFAAVDNRFYQWNEPLHTRDGFFGRIFPYERYRGGRVLEVGCGLGTMAMNWAEHGARVTAVDLNPVAAAQTAHRFRLLGLPGSMTQTDADALPFRNGAFDYAYSWGVLHHSPNLRMSIEELFRVLRPGGEFGVMVYHRDSIRYRYRIRYVEGFLHGESRFLGPLELASRYTDGLESEGNPHTWPVTRREMEALFAPTSERLRIDAFGEELDSIFDLLLPKVRRYIPKTVKRSWARRWGWSLWISGSKKRL
jgi:SAM-dependent methyltransferase